MNKVNKDKERNYIKESIFQEGIKILTKASNYIRQTLIEWQEEIDKFPITVGDFNTSFIKMDRSRRQKISTNITKLNYNITQMDTINIYKLCHATISEYTFYQTFVEHLPKFHILGHKTHLHKLKKIEIILHLLSDHNGMKLKINNGKVTGKSQNMWKLNNTLLNIWIKEEISKGIEKYSELNKNENKGYQNLWDAVKAVLTGEFIALNAYI